MVVRAPLPVPRSLRLVAEEKGTFIPPIMKYPFDCELLLPVVRSVSWASRIVAPAGISPAVVPKIESYLRKNCRSVPSPLDTPSMPTVVTVLVAAA